MYIGYNKVRLQTISFIILFFVNVNIYITTAQTRYYIETPRGNDVPDTYNTDEITEQWRAYWDDQYGHHFTDIYERSTGEYNCHGYAWHMSVIDMNEKVWIGAHYEGSEEIYFEEPIGDGSFDQMPSVTNATHVSYSGDHSARTTSNPDYYVSKFGYGPRGRHYKTSVPTGYGTPNQFFRRSVDVPQDYSTVQSAVNAASSGQTVQVLNGTYNGNINMSNKMDVNLVGEDQTNTIINGNVYLINTELSSIINITVGAVNDLYGWYNNLAFVTANGSIHYESSMANSGFIYSPSAVDLGLHIADSDVDIDYSTIENKSWASVLGEISANLYVEETQLCQNNLDVESWDNANWMYFYNCLFSSSTPGGSILQHDDEVSWNYWQYCSPPLGKNSVVSKDRPSNLISDLDKLSKNNIYGGKTEYEKIYKKFTDLGKSLFDSKDISSKKIKLDNQKPEYRNLIPQFENILTSAPGTISSLKTLRNLTNIYRILGEQDNGINLIKSVEAKKEYSEIRPHVRKMLLPLYLDKKEYKTALALYDELLIELPKCKEAASLMYAKAVVLKYLLNDENNAVATFDQLVKDYPTSIYALKYSADWNVKDAEGKTLQSEITTKSLEVSNYPNPFNPSTTISYTIPEDGRVSIKVFDVLGREIAVLMDGVTSAGKHNVVWDGSNSASGIYFYSITFKGKVLNNKMLLVK